MSKKVGIIGGGLAGLTLSIQLAKRGIEVLLFEKEQYPYHKVCGEYVSMESWNYLVDCGIPLSQLNLPRITQLQVSAPSGRFLEHSLSLGGFGISRFTLDSLLAEEAKRRGVQLFHSTKIDSLVYEKGTFYLESNRQTFETQVAVGAFGKRSILDHKLNRTFVQKALPPQQNFVGIKYHVRLKQFDSRRIELHNFKDGYCGISKIEGDRYCMCYLTTAQNLREQGSISAMEKNILQKNPFLKKYFDEAEFLYDAPLVISQINFEDKSAVDNHLLMAGDAAGLIAPLCGNGMSMAMHASKMLSDLIPDFLEGKLSRQELEMGYQKNWTTHFSRRLKIGRWIQYSFGRETLSNWMIGALRHFPKVVGKLESLTHGTPF